jgi:hypothetical protein
MKKFLVITAIFMLVAIGATVVVFWLVSQQSVTPVEAVVVKSEVAEVETDAVNDETPVLSATGVSLQELSLTEAQTDALSTLGIDETFVVTPAVLACATEKLGADRVAEITAGQAPELVESVQLLPCISVEQ